MKLSEVARYWAAKELTRIERKGHTITFRAPFACQDLTVRFETATAGAPRLLVNGVGMELKEVKDLLKLAPNTWYHAGATLTACFAMPKGVSTLATA